ncbi:hypothetical protein F8S13_16740 [Chloroflexia bacterium SDU3-3]|nr:hypothetical protein F8S13_16740 [Chloroflexia bacterium SDU3-3]
MMLAQLDMTLAQLDMMLARLNMMLAQLNMMLARLNMTLARLNMMLAQLDMMLARLNMTLAQLDMMLARLDMMLARLDMMLARLDMMLAPHPNAHSQFTGPPHKTAGPWCAPSGGIAPAEHRNICLSHWQIDGLAVCAPVFFPAYARAFMVFVFFCSLGGLAA